MEEPRCCVFFCFGSFHFTMFMAVKSETKLPRQTLKAIFELACQDRLWHTGLCKICVGSVSTLSGFYSISVAIVVIFHY